MSMLKIGIRIALLIVAAYECSGLKNVQMKAPEAAERNIKVVLMCLYELEKFKEYHEELYQVKWHRGDREFCRYEPRSVPPLKIFPISGIEVVRGETVGEKLTIIPRNRSTAEGTYMCEVTADAPSFQTQRVFAHIYIVDLPDDIPDLSDLQVRYKLGSKLVANCTSGESIPAANISFYVNGHPAPPRYVYTRVDGPSPDGPMTSFGSIQFTIGRRHLNKQREIRIRCVAFIHSIYWRSNEKMAFIDYSPPTTTVSSWWNPERNAVKKPKPTVAKTDCAASNEIDFYYLIFIISITLLLPSVLK